jgi:hypothetical protein
MKEKVKTYLFWLTSNRGSDEKAIWELPASYKAADIKEALEGWCSHLPAWNHGDNMVSYGYKPINQGDSEEGTHQEGREMASGLCQIRQGKRSP